MLTIEKIKNKKVLNICLFFGITLMIAVASCTPMFKEGSLDMLIRSKLEDNMINNNEFPFTLSRTVAVEDEALSYENLTKKLEGYFASWEGYLGVNPVSRQQHIYISGENASVNYGNSSVWTDIGCYVGFKEHSLLLAGDYGDSPDNYKEGVFPCVMTEQTMDKLNLVLGEEITFGKFKDGNGNPLILVITGIIKPETEASFYWAAKPWEKDNIKQLLVDESVLREIINSYNVEKLCYGIYELFDYRDINSKNIEDIEYYINEFTRQDECLKNNVMPLIKEYKNDKNFVNTICVVLELPVFILLLAFICMVVNQILGMEKGEISLLFSRGFRRGKIVWIYFMQAVFLAFNGILVGVPLSFGLCKIAGSMDGFLKPVAKDLSAYKFTWTMLLYALSAGCVAVIFIVIPAFIYAGKTTVERRSIKNAGRYKKSIWVYLLGIFLLVLSLYLASNYKKQSELLMDKVIAGEKLDYMVFLNVTLTLLGFSFFALIILNGIVRLILLVGHRLLKPATYVALLQISRGGFGVKFIQVFLIFTVSLSIVNANIAGTINKNYEERLSYDVGADIRVKENWTIKRSFDTVNQTVISFYEEPDFMRFSSAMNDEDIKMTRVLRDDGIGLASKKGELKDCTMLGINTKEFGEVAELKEGVNERHWFYDLNELAVTVDGAIITKNLADRLALKVGDTLNISRTLNVNSDDEKAAYTKRPFTVCGIVEAFPSCSSYKYVYDENDKLIMNEQYAVIVNYAYCVSLYGDSPYEVWINTDNKADLKEVSGRLEKSGMNLVFAEGKAEEISKLKSSAVIQITNGLFSLGFIIGAIICIAGFLIYWIAGIKQREGLFGIYRAMGMSFGEVNKMIILEQLLTSLLSGVIGGFAGIFAALVHTDIFAVAYLPKKHNLPLYTEIDFTNLRHFLLMLLVMVAVSLAIAVVQIRKLNITQAVKMGDD